MGRPCSVKLIVKGLSLALVALCLTVQLYLAIYESDAIGYFAKASSQILVVLGIGALGSFALLLVQAAARKVATIPGAQIATQRCTVVLCDIARKASCLCAGHKKHLLLSFSVLALLYVAPIAILMSRSRGTEGYFYWGKCMGGHEIFRYFNDQHFMEYCPGHRQLEPRYLLRTNGNGWEAINDKGKVAFLLRVQQGELTYASILHTNQWTTLKRVHNPWRLWLPRALPEQATEWFGGLRIRDESGQE